MPAIGEFRGPTIRKASHCPRQALPYIVTQPRSIALNQASNAAAHHTREPRPSHTTVGVDPTAIEIGVKRRVSSTPGRVTRGPCISCPADRIDCGLPRPARTSSVPEMLGISTIVLTIRSLRRSSAPADSVPDSSRNQSRLPEITHRHAGEQGTSPSSAKNASLSTSRTLSGNRLRLACKVSAWRTCPIMLRTLCSSASSRIRPCRCAACRARTRRRRDHLLLSSLIIPGKTRNPR